MITSHEFAKQLLEGPNLPIYHPPIIDDGYADDDRLEIPTIVPVQAVNNDTEQEEAILLISYVIDSSNA